MNTEQKKALIEPGHPKLSIRKQCDLLSLNRSSFYYQPVGIDGYTLLLMRLIDEQYTRTPYFEVVGF